ncbi:MAG: DMT family transporter [Deltaproteobacteria bacterium]|nr:DMT family transporter [Deltaproteobacteria bacterium]
MSSLDVSRREALLADSALVVVTAIWGSTFVVNELVLKETPPLLFLALRYGLAAGILVFFARGRPWTPGLVKDSAILGVLLSIGIGCQLVGQLFTSASKAAFITGLSVPLTPVAGWLLHRQVPSGSNLFGLILAAGGFGLMSWPTGATGLDPGDLLVLLTAFVYAVVFVEMGVASPKHDVRAYSAGQIVFAFAGVLVGRFLLTPFLGRPEPLFVAEGRPLAFTPTLLLAVLWMGIVASVVTTLVQTWAQARMPAVHAAVIFALEPVFTALFAAVALGERLTAREAWGGGLVLLGIVVSELRLRR